MKDAFPFFKKDKALNGYNIGHNPFTKQLIIEEEKTGHRKGLNQKEYSNLIKGSSSPNEEFFNSTPEYTKDELNLKYKALIDKEWKQSPEGVKTMAELADHGHGGAMLSLGRKKLEDKEIEEGKAWIEASCSRGWYGEYYLAKHAKEQGNIEETIKWYKKGSESNDADCSSSLADIYYFGETADNKKDYETAKYYYEISLNQKQKAYPLQKLGLMELWGRLKSGVNLDRGFELLHKAAEMGSARAHYWLGVAYEEAESGKYTDNKKAWKHMKKASELGDEDAQTWIKEKAAKTLPFKKEKILHQDKVISKAVQLLASHSNRSVILIGEPGSGRKSLIKDICTKMVEEPKYKKTLSYDLADDNTTLININERIPLDWLMDYKPGPNFVPNEQHLIADNIKSWEALKEAKPYVNEYIDVIEVSPLNTTQTLEILEIHKERLESHHKLSILPEALKRTVELAQKGIWDKVLPGSALELLDKACSYASHNELPSINEQTILEAFNLHYEKNKISTEDIPHSVMLEGLEKMVLGQPEPIKEIAQTLGFQKKKSNKRPKGVFLISGPSGVGKSETAKALAKILLGSENRITRIDMGSFGDSGSTSRLLGAAPGLVGYKEGGLLSNAAKNDPYSIILLDEVEKAHPKIWDNFLAIFDEGETKDGSGNTINFSNNIFVLTTNIGNNITDQRRGTNQTEQIQSALKDYFRPELLARINNILIYKPLEKNSLNELFNRLLENLNNEIKEDNIQVVVPKDTIEQISETSLEIGGGARTHQLLFNERFRIPILKLIAKGELPPQTYEIGWDNNKLTAKSTEKTITTDAQSSTRTGEVNKGIFSGKAITKKEMEETLRKRVKGQDQAISTVSEAIIKRLANLGSPNKPLGIYLMVGPPGTGKTEMAKAISELLYGNENNLIRFDMSSYASLSDLTRLIGSGPGWVGSQDGGELTNAVMSNPYRVILLDEIEKAHPKILNTFLPIFDEGKTKDASGKTANFCDSLFLITSNLGCSPGKKVDINNIMNSLKAAMLPEVIDRITCTIAFNPINEGVLEEIIKSKIYNINEGLVNRIIKVTEKSLKDMAKEYSVTGGARYALKAIDSKIISPLAELIMEGSLPEGIIDIEIEGAETKIKQGAYKKSIYTKEQITATPSLYNSSGSGFFVGENGQIMTNAHVIKNAERIEVYLAGEKEPSPAKLVCIDSANDLAIISVEKNSTPIPISDRFPTLGEEVFPIGYPLIDILGESPKATQGIVSSTKGMRDTMSNFQISAEIYPGNSGGPVFDSSGNVLGISVGGVSNEAAQHRGATAAGLNYAIKPKYAILLMQELNITSTPKNEGTSTITETLNKYQKSIVLIKCQKREE
jgi:ATP-dependent Clp protease ATP-binding subunit ClpA